MKTTPSAHPPEITHQQITIPAGAASLLEGELILPARASAVVLFAHGSGSSRLSPRNIYVASVLQQHGIGTLLFDLLTREEDQELRHPGRSTIRGGPTG